MNQSHLSQDEATIAYLTGTTVAAPHPISITAPDSGGKFTPDGHVLPFPGNTFLCHIDQNSRAFVALCKMQDALMQGAHAQFFTFLPKSSFHMTVFCGVSGVSLRSDGWPEGFPQDTSLDAFNSAFLDRLGDTRFPEKMRVSANYLYGGYSIRANAADPSQERVLRGLRNHLRDKTGLFRPDHDSYEFHITLAYPTTWMDEQEARELVEISNCIFAAHRDELEEIELGPVEFCVMDDMHEFRPIALLKPNGLEQQAPCAQ